MDATKKICPICESNAVSIFLGIPQVPVNCNVLWSTRDEAIRAPKGDIQLGFCRSCGHIYNFLFEPDILDYTQDYENSLHYSPRFQKYAEYLAGKLVESHGLFNKDIIDIGCGAGNFLKLLCHIGGNRGLGFDPSRIIDRSASLAKDGITLIKDFYSKRYSNCKADAICCRHVLEHIQSPRQFLHTVRQTLNDRLSTIVFFEVPNVLFTLKELGIWDLIYEHPSYFSLPSFAVAFNSTGFKVFRIYEAFEGQFLCIEAFPTDESENSSDSYSSDLEKLTTYVLKFADKYRSKLKSWDHKLKQIISNGKRAVLWGAGSKGVTFMNSLGVTHQIEYVIDLNPYKQGKYVAGTGQEIMRPEFLRKYRPDIVIVMNPIYYEEIKKSIDNMDLAVEMIVA